LIRVGFEKGTANPVNISISHTVVAGITRSGKSETVKALISRADARFLIFDVKRPRDYSGIGTEIPIYVQEKTDPLMLKRLLESQSHLALKFEFPELIKVCKKEDTFEGILQAVNEGLKSKVHPIVENKLLVLQHLLSKLVDELNRTPISDKLELKSKINVMDLSEVSLELQQLAVHSTLKTLLEKEKNIIVVLDEAHRFIPQSGSNASKETVTRYIKEGGAKGLWLYLVDQTITGIDKQVLKQCWIWILGKQREVNEAKRTVDQIPFKTGLNEKSIMRLKVGEFVVCTEDGAKLTYVQPAWLSEEVARNVALGRVSVKDVADAFLKSQEEENEMVWKERYEELKRDFDKKLVEKLEESLRKQRVAFGKHLEMAKKRIDELEAEVERLREDLKSADLLKQRKDEEIEQLRKELEGFRELKDALRKIIAPDISELINRLETAKDLFPEGKIPSEIQISTERPSITIKRKRTPLQLTDKDLHGKIAIVYSEGALGDGWFSVSDVVKAFNSHAWSRDPRISKALDDFTRWGYLEKKYAGRKPIYRILIKPEEAKTKGLLKVENPK